MKQKKWCVTGAAGFLGSHVLEQLIQAEQSVLAIDDLSWGIEKHLKPLSKSKLNYFSKTDIRQEQKVAEELNQFRPDYIVHLAALHYIPEAIKNPCLALDINVRGTQSLLKAARNCGCQTFFFASTGDVYEKTEADNDESQTLAQPYNIYGLSKLFGESLIQLEQSQYQEKKMIVGRIYNLIGPRETNPHIIPEIIKQLKVDQNKLSLGNIWPTRDYVPVNECARAIIDLCMKTTDPLTTVNIATGVGQSVEMLIQQIEKILGNSILVEKDPNKVRSVERARLVANVSKLKKLIGWAPTSRVESILRELFISEGFKVT
ncbi:GDP-mannose 4,6-dehydratase [bacterium]|nr:GDP-mannose 4,6-dehydratase [bacterium]